MTTFSVFEQQRKRGVAWHDTVQTSKVMCEDLGQPSSSLTHAHKSKCLFPLNVSLWPLECLSHRKLYILCFFFYFLVVNTVYPAVDTIWRQFFKWHKHVFSSLQLLRKKFTKTTLCKQYIIVWNVKLYIFLKFDKVLGINMWKSNTVNVWSPVWLQFLDDCCCLLALAPLRRRLIASRVSEQLYFSWFYTFRKWTQSQGGKSGELDRWWAKPECLWLKIPTVQIVASESPPSDTSGCYSRTLYPQPCAGERIHDAQPDKCWKKCRAFF